MSRFIFVLLMLFTLQACRKRTDNGCTEEAYVIIDYVTNCNFLIQMASGEVYQAVNLQQFSPTFVDSQHVKIDYAVLTDPPTCNAIAQIEILCLSDYK